MVAKDKAGVEAPAMKRPYIPVPFLPMDIGEIGDSLTSAVEEGTEVEIKHPGTGQSLDWFIRVAGYESDRCRKELRRQSNAALKAQRRKVTFDDREDAALRLAASAIISWRFEKGATIHGEQPECTFATALDYLRKWPWMGEQLDAVAGDRAAFLPT